MQLARAGSLFLRGSQAGTSTVRLLQASCRPAVLEASRLGLQPRCLRPALRCCSAHSGSEGRPAVAKLHVVVGPMFSGKTTSLLAFMEESERQKKKCMLVKSAKDTRSAVDRVKAHTGEEMACLAFSKLMDFATTKEYMASEVVGIDEAQFFPDLLEFCKRAVDDHGKTVFVAGLDGDYRRERFGDVLSLIPIADSVEKRSGKCGMDQCTNESAFTLRTVKASQVELIGGGESYKPVCRGCYNRAMQQTESGRVTSAGAAEASTSAAPARSSSPPRKAPEPAAAVAAAVHDSATGGHIPLYPSGSISTVGAVPSTVGAGSGGQPGSPAKAANEAGDVANLQQKVNAIRAATRNGAGAAASAGAP